MTAPAADAGKVIKRDTLKGRVIRRELAATKVADAVGPVYPGMEVFGLTMGLWSMLDLVEYLVAATGPAHFYAATWTIGANDVGFLGTLLRNRGILSARFVVDYSFLRRDPAYCDALRAAFGDEAIRVTKNHSKVSLLRNDRWNLVVRGSMNFNENYRLENFEVSDDAALAEWVQSIFDELFAKQTAVEAFERRPIEHVESFGREWGVEGKPQRFSLSDETFGNDLRRAGLTGSFRV